MLARDCLLTNVHLKILTEAVAEYNPKLIPVILPHLVLAIPKVERACINSSLLYLPSSHNLRQKPVFAKKLQQSSLFHLKEILRFNAGNPNGRYELGLSNPMQYAVAERVFTLNTWGSAIARKAGRLDMSQGGSYNAIRNFRISGIMQHHDLHWEMPGDGYIGSGDLVFDYVCPSLPSSRSKPLNKDLFERISTVLRREGTDISESSRYSAIRLVSHHLMLTADQLSSTIDTFAGEDRRIDLYCELHCRCCEFGSPLVDVHKGVLEKLFPWHSRCVVTARLGLINTIDWLNVHLDPLTSRGRDVKSHRKAVWHSLRDKPRNRYTLNLAHHDEHLLAITLLKLAGKEPGHNLMSPIWSEARTAMQTSALYKNISMDGIKWGVPSAWFEGNVPHKGIFEVTYVVENTSSIGTKFRESCGMQCGWVKTIPPK